MKTEPSRIRVTGGGDYEVVIGRGLDSEVVSSIRADAARVAVIHPGAVRGHAERLSGLIEAAGFTVLAIEVPDGEAAKALAVADRCWSALGRAGFTRSDVVVGVGGGTTTDLAGFVAATWLRGVALVQVPTTLLGMVDAAVGGKTGINTDVGKNLVGCFHSPSAVVADTSVLATVPTDDYAAGLAEVIKVGFVRDPAILDLIAADPSAATDPASDVTHELIIRAVQVKADVVSADFLETGAAAGGGIGRETLNYGHTFGHAVERVEGYSWRHGAAVGVGMVFAAELSRLSGHLEADDVRLHRQILAAVGLPASYRPDRWPQLLEVMAIDKKTRANTMRFVILERLGSPVVLENPDARMLENAYASLAQDRDRGA